MVGCFISYLSINLTLQWKPNFYIYHTCVHHELTTEQKEEIKTIKLLLKMKWNLPGEFCEKLKIIYFGIILIFSK